MRVVIIGGGYVGLTTGAVLAYIGHDTICVDINEAVIERLQQGEIPIHEPYLDEVLEAGRQRLTFTTKVPDLQDVDVVIIAVGTPGQRSGAVNFTYVTSAVESIAAAITGDHIPVVANKSTVPLGAARHVQSLLSRLTGRDDVVTVSNPEFLAEGTAVRDSFYPDRVLVGSDSERGFAVMQELYRPLLQQSFTPPDSLPRAMGQPLPLYITTSALSAELSKYAANCFLATKISFINEFAALSDAVGADIQEVARAIGADKRIGAAFLRAGAGWGGSCFGKDTAGIIDLAANYGCQLKVVEAAVQANIDQKNRIVAKLQQRLKTLRGATVAVLGLAFKPGTDDVRDAPALAIIPALLDHGVYLKIHDPVATERFLAVCDVKDAKVASTAQEACEGADAVVLLTEWTEYGHIHADELAKHMKGTVVIDGRNVWKRSEVEAAGLTYVGVGT